MWNWVLDLQLPWRNPSLEENMELVLSIVKSIRSIKQDYQMNKMKPEGLSQCLYF